MATLRRMATSQDGSAGSRTTAVTALDVMAFCRHGSVLEGQWPLRRMSRLAASLEMVDAEAMTHWSTRGSLVNVAGAEPQIWLHLQGQAKVSLQCQRCLQTMTEPLQVDRRFRFVRSEAEAARLDEDSDDDVLALEPRLDLMGLLEDELILGLPLVPRHAVCPQPLLPAVDTHAVDEPLPNPFAALAALRKRLAGLGEE